MDQFSDDTKLQAVIISMEELKIQLAIEVDQLDEIERKVELEAAQAEICLSYDEDMTDNSEEKIAIKSLDEINAQLINQIYGYTITQLNEKRNEFKSLKKNLKGIYQGLAAQVGNEDIVLLKEKLAEKVLERDQEAVTSYERLDNEVEELKRKKSNHEKLITSLQLQCSTVRHNKC